MSESVNKTLSITLNTQDDVNVKLASSIANLRRGNVLAVSLSSVSNCFAEPDLLLVNALLSAARRYDFEQLSPPYNGSKVIRFKYNGAELPEGVSLGVSNDHIPSVRKLFHSVFGHPLSHEFWRWKYDHGLGLYSAVLLKDNEVVAHYGVIPRKLCFMGSVYTGLQACDSMVHKNSRGRITSSYLATLMAFGLKQFDLSTTSITEDKPVCFFGFPHGRALKLGERLSEYKNLGNLFNLVITPNSFESYRSAKPMNPVTQLSDKQSIKNHWQKAWQSMSADTDYYVMGQRNWKYGNWRYLCHPNFDYEFWGDALAESILVLRKQTDSSYMLIDYVGRLSDMVSCVAALYAALLKRDSKARLSFWQLEQFANHFLLMGKAERMKAGFTAKFIGDVEFLEREQWWIMMGDSDFL